jgi:hypothetical protein
MKEPIKAGDECIVIGGALGARSRNIGRRVIAVSSDGQELLMNTPDGVKNFGRIWRCRTKDGGAFIRHDPFAHYDVPPNQADFAASWLQKADPEDLPGVKTETDKELTA